MNPLAALYAAHADRMATEARTNAPDRFWCPQCPGVPHRVRTPNALCPVCEGESA